CTSQTLPVHRPLLFNGTATPAIYTLSLHDALPISRCGPSRSSLPSTSCRPALRPDAPCRPGKRPTSATGTWSPGGWQTWPTPARSEEHTSELQSRENLVCRLLLEKKKNKNYKRYVS